MRHRGRRQGDEPRADLRAYNMPKLLASKYKTPAKETETWPFRSAGGGRPPSSALGLCREGMAWPPANALLLAEISTGAATEPLAKMTEGQAAEAS